MDNQVPAENLRKEKLLSMLGLMRRAGKLVPGFDAVQEALQNGSISGVLIAADLSEKSEKNLRFHADKVKVPVLRTGATIDEISHAIGKKAGIAAVADQGFFLAASNIIASGAAPESHQQKG